MMERTMNLRLTGLSAAALLALALSAAPAAQAQGLTWMFDAGLAVPVGTFDDYFEAGATASAEIAYPLQDRFDVTFGVDWDHYNSHAYYGTPNLNQWRFQVGILADLLGQRNGPFTIEGRARAGASSLASQEDFWREQGTLGVNLARDRVSFSKKGLAGSAGLRVRFGGDSRLNGFVGVDGNWAQLGTDATQVLRDAEPAVLGELNSAVSYSITAGFSFGP
jgi:hypothetical protein